MYIQCLAHQACIDIPSPLHRSLPDRIIIYFGTRGVELMQAAVEARVTAADGFTWVMSDSLALDLLSNESKYGDLAKLFEGSLGVVPAEPPDPTKFVQAWKDTTEVWCWSTQIGLAVILSKCICMANLPVQMLNLNYVLI